MRPFAFAIAGSLALAVTLGAAPVHAAAAPEQTRLTARLSTTKISIGQSAVVSGRLEAASPSGWQPLANRTVDLRVSGAGRPGPFQVTTGPQGEYSYRLSAVRGSTGEESIEASFQDTDDTDPSYAWASAPLLRLRVPVTRSSGGGSISTDSHGEVTLSGSFYPDLKRGARVSIQYSPNGRNGWKQMAVTRADRYGYFTGTATLPRSGYWRARYAGDADNYSATALEHKNWRWNTHFTAFKAARSGAKIKASGTLVRYFSNTRKGGFARQRVSIIFRPRGEKGWYIIGSARTDAKGRFSTKVRRYGPGHYLAYFGGTHQTWACDSRRPIRVSSVPFDPATTSALSGVAGLPVPAVVDTVRVR